MKLLQEINPSDQYGGEWDNFVKKYKKFKKDNTLFVQFTNFATGNNLEKKAYDNPDHSDPIGTYGYPLKYVLDYPGDVWYGANAKYIRVLKNRFPDKTIQLQYLTSYRVQSYLKMMFSEDKNIYHFFGRANSHLEMENKKIKHLRSFQEVLPARIFFYIIQHDMEKYNDAHHNYEFLSGKEQTSLLRKTGMYAIEDRAKNEKLSIINPREPEQIIFLYPQAYTILDTYQLQGKKDIILSTNDINSYTNYRKIAFLVAKELGETFRPSSPFGGIKFRGYTLPDSYGKYFTKEGTEIKVCSEDLSLSYRMNHFSSGYKHHKLNKKINPHVYKVSILGPKGKGQTYIGYQQNSIEAGIIDLVKSLDKERGQIRTPQMYIDEYLEYLENKVKEREEKEKEDERIHSAINKLNVVLHISDSKREKFLFSVIEENILPYLRKKIFGKTESVIFNLGQEENVEILEDIITEMVVEDYNRFKELLQSASKYLISKKMIINLDTDFQSTENFCDLFSTY